MAEDIASLGIKVDSKQVVKATRSLDKLETQAGQNEKANKSLGASFGGLRTVVTALAGSLAVSKFIETAGSFESMAISLEVVTGSAEKATAAMAGIREFAKNTPFQVSEITDAFIKLKALGLTPSEAALRSYGDTASAMGKSLNQMIEAVADASTGEFERLKEFGIKAKSQGDDVAFTFQGVTTTVKKNAEEIEGFLRGIGETKFAGAMSKQMDTINGKISNLGDSFDSLMVTYANLGAGEGAKGALDFAIDAVNSLTTGIEALPLLFTVIFAEFDKMATNISFGARSLYEDITGLFDSKGEVTARQAALNSELEKELDLIDQIVISTIAAEGAKREAKAGAGGLDAAAGGAIADTGQTEAERIAELYTLDEEQLQTHQAAQITLVNEHNAAKIIAEQELQARLGDIEAQGIVARRKFEEMNTKQKVTNLLGQAKSLSSGMATQSKSMFAVNKAAALASAVVETSSAVVSSWKNAGGYPWGVVPAAAMLAAGLSRINQIKSTSFSGGGSVSGGIGGGAATTPSSIGTSPQINGIPVQDTQPRQQTTIVLQNADSGINLSGQGMRDFVESLNDALGEGTVQIA